MKGFCLFKIVKLPPADANGVVTLHLRLQSDGTVFRSAKDAHTRVNIAFLHEKTSPSAHTEYAVAVLFGAESAANMQRLRPVFDDLNLLQQRGLVDPESKQSIKISL